MDKIEQPFDGITHMGGEPVETRDRVELIDNDPPPKGLYNGDSPRAENSPLHSGKSTNSLLHGPQNHGLRVIIISSIVFAVAVTVALILTIYLEPKEIHGHAAVASEDVRCSDMGLQILRDGGNAVDAAVATAFCVGVVDPSHAGIGGGGFAIVHDHKFLKTSAYDFREVAPQALPTLTEADVLSVKSTGVPGMVKGLYAMHQEHGVLPWKDVLYPSIELAESDYAVSESLVKLSFPHVVLSIVRNNPLLAKLILQPNGKFKTVHDNMTFPEYADTLRVLVNEPDALYTGQLVSEFVAEVQKLGGLITEDDMRNYSVETPKTFKSTFKGQTLIGLPPPASGSLVAMILNVVDNLGWTDKMKNDPLMYHQLIESFRYAFGHRVVLGDPAFNPGMAKNVEELLDSDLAKRIAEEIKKTNKTFSDPKHYGPGMPPKDKGTSHISVIDSSELMVSMTISLNYHFGNQIMLQSGILLNNELMDFDLTSGSNSANIPEPGKRPLSSMSPTILYNEEHPCAHRVIIGAANGSRIITGVSETLINSVVFKMNITDAVVAPRIHNQLEEYTYYEKGIPADVIAELQKMGHNPVLATEGLSMVQAIEKTNDDLQAMSDPRDFGKAAEF